MPAEISEEILKLIGAEEDSKDKAFLLVLYKIAQTAETNARLTSQLNKSLEEHREEFATHINRGTFSRGRWEGMLKITVPVLSFLQVIVLAVVGYMITGHDKNTDLIYSIQSRVSALEARK